MLTYYSVRSAFFAFISYYMIHSPNFLVKFCSIYAQKFFPVANLQNLSIIFSAKRGGCPFGGVSKLLVRKYKPPSMEDGAI